MRIEAALAAGLLAGLAVTQSVPGAATLPEDDAAVVHVLNRIGYGPGPGDAERVRALGLGEYIERQLHPDRIADTEADARTARLETVKMSADEIARTFEQPVIEARRARQRAAAAGAGTLPAQPMRAAQGSPRQNASKPLAELAEHKLLRAVYSERQLQEVLTDFWFNHFNVDARKGRTRFLLTEYEREAIRPHVLGQFRDLLAATAKSPAMLFYLDNWMSADPDAQRRPVAVLNRRGANGRAMRLPPTPTTARRRGLNENYGRELLELHTLGVDGGYTQKDVTEVARVFTGWTIDGPRQGAGFRFDPRLHDGREKTVLGERIRPNGMSEGEDLLDRLARHPSTALTVAARLTRRFVADEPPPALVDRAAARFRETDGDLREVMRVILLAPEFLSPDGYRAKVKTPLEFVVSALRATGADVADARPLTRVLQEMGMPLYQCQPPTGYTDTADAWTSAGALVDRMNFALDLAAGKIPGSRIGAVGASDIADAIAGADASSGTRATVAKATSPAQALALALGSPEFQRR